MIDFCHITPVPHLDLVDGRKTHLILAHLLEENDVYLKYYRKLGEQYDVTLIMDNSAFEMFKRNDPMYPTEKLVDLALDVGASYVVMSDYPTEHSSKTMKAAESMIPELRDNNLGTFYCPQCLPGDIENLMAGYAWGFCHPEIDYIAVSILNIPLAFGVESGNNLQRFMSRWRWMNMLEERELLYNDKKIHFLGMVDGPREIELVKDYHDVIDTWDSSAAVWAGLNGIMFDNSPTGLKDGKFEKEVDFSIQFGDTKMARYNMKFIDKLSEGWNGN